MAVASAIDNYLMREANGIEYSSGLNSEVKSSGWSDDLELRVQTNGSIGLRMQPVYGDEREAQKSLQNTNMLQQVLSSNKALDDGLLRRYFNVIDVLSLYLDKNNLQKNINIIEDEVKTLSSLSLTSEFNAEKLQSLVHDLDRSKTQFSLIQKRLEIVKNTMQLSEYENYDNFINDLINPSHILNVIEQNEIIIGNAQEVPTVKIAKLNKDVAHSRLKLVRSQQDFGVEIVELEYGDGAIGLMMGFRLPSGGNARKFEREFNLSRADSNYKLMHDLMQESIQKKRSDIEWDLIVWKSDQEALKKLDNIMMQPSRLQSPELISGLQKQQLALYKNIKEVHVRMLGNFVELLHVTGLLNQTPFKNWLRSN